MTNFNKYGEIQDSKSHKGNKLAGLATLDRGPWILGTIAIVAIICMMIYIYADQRSIDNKREALKQQISVTKDGDYAIANGIFLEAYRDEIPLVRVDLIIDKNDVDYHWDGFFAVTACPKATAIKVNQPDAKRGWKSEYPVGSKWRMWGTISKSDSSFTLNLHRAERL